MIEGPNPWDLLLRHIQGIVAGLILVTATLLVGIIGLAVLSYIWVGVLLALALTYALKWRGEVKRTKKDIHALREELSTAKKIEIPEPVPEREDVPITSPTPENVPTSLEHVATVTLDTEVTPLDSYREPLDEGEVVEVEAESTNGETFHFFVCDENDFETNRYRSVNFEKFDGKEFTQRFKKRIVIPYSDTWYFFAYTPAGEEFATVHLKISRVR